MHFRLLYLKLARITIFTRIFACYLLIKWTFVDFQNFWITKLSWGYLPEHEGWIHDKKMACRTWQLHPKPKILVTVEAYLSATFGPNIADFFDLCFHWVSVVRVSEGDRTTQSTSTWNFFFSAKVQETVSMSRRLAYRRQKGVIELHVNVHIFEHDGKKQ